MLKSFYLTVLRQARLVHYPSIFPTIHRHPTFPSLMMSRRCQRRSVTVDFGGSCRVSVPEPWFTLRDGTPFLNSAWEDEIPKCKKLSVNDWKWTLGQLQQLLVTKESWNDLKMLLPPLVNVVSVTYEPPAHT